jgi:hypothetical protein
MLTKEQKAAGTYLAPGTIGDSDLPTSVVLQPFSMRGTPEISSQSSKY